VKRIDARARIALTGTPIDGAANDAFEAGRDGARFSGSSQDRAASDDGEAGRKAAHSLDRAAWDREAVERTRENISRRTCSRLESNCENVADRRRETLAAKKRTRRRRLGGASAR
jgi:hypothetical protein